MSANMDQGARILLPPDPCWCVSMLHEDELMDTLTSAKGAVKAYSEVA